MRCTECHSSFLLCCVKHLLTGTYLLTSYLKQCPVRPFYMLVVILTWTRKEVPAFTFSDTLWLIMYSSGARVTVLVWTTDSLRRICWVRLLIQNYPSRSLLKKCTEITAKEHHLHIDLVELYLSSIATSTFSFDVSSSHSRWGRRGEVRSISLMTELLDEIFYRPGPFLSWVIISNVEYGNRKTTSRDSVNRFVVHTR